ncbi:hypothetical protein M433DRAFT_147295 [Acidomyces richmondensis BFW]|nr:hypothetical protein M433DRAFT_147295 [Acidomyces richmondensis BFW]
MIFLGTGSVLAYALDAAFYRVENSWRYMYQSKILAIEAGVSQAKALTDEISVKVSLDMLFRISANLGAGIAAYRLVFCGFNTLMYYSSTLFDIVGFSNSIAVGSVVAIVNWIFTVLSIALIDRIGRRRLLLWIMWGMPVCLIPVVITFHWVRINDQTLKLTSDVVGWPAILVLVAMIIFVAFYAAGLGCVPWQANQFLPMEVRSMGTMMVNVFNWHPNLVVSSTFLSMMKSMTPSGTFGFYSGLCFLDGCASNMILEEVRRVFEHGFGVRYAEQWRREYRSVQKLMWPAGCL